MRTLWTLTKTAMALTALGILLAPTLRELGFLPPQRSADDAHGDTDATPLPRKRRAAKAAAEPTSVEAAAALAGGNGGQFPHH